MKWKKLVIHIEGYPNGVYINEDDTRAIIFPPFGRFYSILSDSSVTKMVLSIFFPEPKEEVDHGRYLRSFEGTDIIQLEEVA